jgi:hypothetical protein
MLMNLLDIQNKINNLMAQFYAQVKGATSIGRTDFNKVAEIVLIPLLSEIYGLSHLRNMNTEKSNFPGIDLADDYARISYQVTATSSSEKIKDTLQKFRDFELYKKYDRLVIYILTEKQNSYPDKAFQEIIGGKFAFNCDKDILDFKDILKTTQDFQVEKALKILKILEDNFSRGETVLYQETADSRKEEVFLNLLAFTFHQDLFIAQIDPEILDFVRNKSNKRKALQNELTSMGYKFGVDWEYFEGKIITFHDLGNNHIPLAKLIDLGSIEVWQSIDFCDVDENHERVFKSLLRRCLQQKLYQRRVSWQNTEKLFIFCDVNNELIRKEHWHGKVESERVVFERTMKNNKPDEILRCKHLAFQVEFKRYQENWFLLIKPDWFFSLDGYNNNPFCESDKDWLKRREKNMTVFAHLRFIAYFLSDSSIELFGNRRPYPFLTFTNILKLDDASFLDDRDWLPVKDNVDEIDDQRQTSFWEDL